jgi:hypothetical protein
MIKAKYATGVGGEVFPISNKDMASERLERALPTREVAGSCPGSTAAEQSPGNLQGNIPKYSPASPPNSVQETRSRCDII